MKTPICDFVNKYANDNKLRLHMPGHKGVSYVGCEKLDITEIYGADSLYEAQGIIAESEKNASEIFGCSTFYSTEGSSQCIRAMVYLISLYAKARGKNVKILAARNAHKAFHSAVALLDVELEWICSDAMQNYLSCNVTPEYLDDYLKRSVQKPTAIYITSPDYIGNLADIKGLSQVCHKHGVLLAVDNAHGAYLKFLSPTLHPIDLGADICCDSAHKTLPVLTGGAYLHIADSVSEELSCLVKDALLLFGSTSPSYLILQSLDKANAYLGNYADRLSSLVNKVNEMKVCIVKHGYKLYGDEPMKITLLTKSYGYYGYELAAILNEKGIVCEFADPDFLTLMISAENESDIDIIARILLSVEKKEPITECYPRFLSAERVIDVREACFLPFETVSVEESLGRVASLSTIGCPPAVPIIVSGERIDRHSVECFKYYGIDKVHVVK